MSYSSLEVVRMTTGIARSCGSFLISRSASRPSFRGMFKSRRMRPGRGASWYFPRRCRKSISSSPSLTVWKSFTRWCSRNASRVFIRSSSSSSAIRMVSGFPVIVSSLACGKIDQEGGAAPGLAPGRDLPAVALDDLAADRESHAGALVSPTFVQPLEELEDPIHVLLIESDSVVGDREVHETVGRRRFEPHHRRLLRFAKLERVADQVLQELSHLQRVGLDGRQHPDLDPATHVRDARLEVADDLPRGLLQVDRDLRLRLGGHAREGEKPLDERLPAGRGVHHPRQPVAALVAELRAVPAPQLVAEHLHL